MTDTLPLHDTKRSCFAPSAWLRIAIARFVQGAMQKIRGLRAKIFAHARQLLSVKILYAICEPPEEWFSGSHQPSCGRHDPGAGLFPIRSDGPTDVASWRIVLQSQQLAEQRIFREDPKREEIAVCIATLELPKSPVNSTRNDKVLHNRKSFADRAGRWDCTAAPPLRIVTGDGEQ